MHVVEELMTVLLFLISGQWKNETSIGAFGASS